MAKRAINNSQTIPKQKQNGSAVQFHGMPETEAETMVRILVVEDDAKLNQAVCAYLNDSGFAA